jgi:hypothetical protein
MQYQWDNNKNLCLKDEQDFFLFDQLPGEVRLQIFNAYLYKDFFSDFKQYFYFRRNETSEVGVNWMMKILMNK